MNDSLIMSFDPDGELIVAAYETVDDLGKILRVHLAIEAQIDSLITTTSRAKVDRRTSFWAKMNLLRAIGVPERLCASCEALNDLRNHFAHNRRATIPNTMAQSERFLGSVAAFFPGLLEAHGTFANRKLGVNHEITFPEASQGQRVVIAAGFLSGVLGDLPKMYEFGHPRQIAVVAGLDL